MIAGWFWTIGHLAGPVTAIYLWRDGRRPCRFAAAVPVGATLLAVLLSIALGAGKIDSTVSFHGRTTREAARPRAGLLHTAQAIPENLVFANLGLRVRTTQTQGMVLTLSMIGFWLAKRLRQGGIAALNPLECAGLALVLGSYFGEWTVRGYFDYYLLRTLSLGFIVPWYDTIPQIGAVLFVAGWIKGPREPDQRAPPVQSDPASFPSRGLGRSEFACYLDRSEWTARGFALAQEHAAAFAQRGREVPDRRASVDARDGLAAGSRGMAKAASRATRPSPARYQASGDLARCRAGSVRPAGCSRLAERL